jgi:primosomal protein N' (replication factor Y)
LASAILPLILNCTKVFVNIIPLVKLRNDLDYFTYSLPTELEPVVERGSVVRVNFRNAEIYGVVLSLTNETPSVKVKPIISVDDDLKLSKWQVGLIEFLSKELLLSMSVLVNSILPDKPKRQTSKIAEPEIAHDFNDTLPLAIDLTQPKQLIKYKDEASKFGALRFLADSLKENEQMAIITPELESVGKLAACLTSKKDRLALYLKKLSVLQTWRNWQNVRCGQAQIIIGTRSSIFAPFANLKYIVIDDEENESHKQEEPNPRFRVHQIADYLAKELNLKVIYFSRAPSLELLHEVAKKNCAYQELKSATKVAELSVIDRSGERGQNEISFLSTQALEEIRETLEQKGRVLLYLNRKGYFRAYVCRDCETPQEISGGHLLSPVCQKCGSPKLSGQGLGLKEAAKVLRQFFPENTVGMLSAEDNDAVDSEIILGTEYALNHLNLQDFKLVIVVSADLFFYLSSYDAVERAFIKLSSLLHSLSSEQKMIIQTFKADHEIFSWLIRDDSKSYYLSEIAQRRQFNLPPFSAFVRLVYRARFLNDGFEEMSRIKSKIEEVIGAEIEVGEPLQVGEDKNRWELSLKIPQDFDLSRLSFLRSEPLVIDAHPLSS